MEAPKLDSRIRRTRDRLGDALVELMLQKPFDSITVQDVLDRAGVGRSTFYEHYRDKNDLFLSDVDEFFQHMSMLLSRHETDGDRVAPVREFFEHLGEVQEFHAALVASGRIHDVFELGRGHFARGIEQRFVELPRAAGLDPVQRTALAHAFSGAFLSLLSWWINDGRRQPAAEMDELFHRTVWSGVESARECSGESARELRTE